MRSNHVTPHPEPEGGSIFPHPEFAPIKIENNSPATRNLHNGAVLPVMKGASGRADPAPAIRVA
jgi:hypothetical protein